MIDGDTQLVGLLGWPVEHSLSPVMHNAVFDALGLNWRYLPLPVRPGQIEIAVSGLVSLGFRGANVTVPHKQAVMPMLDTLTPGAKELGAVNTLLIRRDHDQAPAVAGHNTDSQGFIDALRQSGFRPGAGSKVVLVGAGGAARAVIFGLLRSGINEIVVLNRDAERARTLVSDLRQNAADPSRPAALPLTPETLVESARAADLLVNATTVGMWPRVEESIWPERVAIPSYLTVFDLVYNPLETRLLRQTRASGACGVDGLGMLVRQGALALDLWTEMGLDVDELSNWMRKACDQVLRR